MKKNFDNIINYIIDFLLAICLIFQDIYDFTIFGTPFYKYIILLMLIILLYNFLFKIKKIKINKTNIIILFILYAYTFIVSFNKNILVPAAFYLIEVITFSLYAQTFNNKDDLKKRLFNIVLIVSAILSVLAIIQFVAYKFDIKFIYKSITQFDFYLAEGRITSIYSEPAHLCTILGAGVFVSLYNYINQNNVSFLLLSILIFFVGLLTSSVVTYVSLVLFLILFIFYYLFIKNNKIKSDKKNTCYIFIVFFLTLLLYFSFFSNINMINSMKNKFSFRKFNLEEREEIKKENYLINENDNFKEKDNISDSKSASKSLNVDHENKNNINIIEQNNNQTSFALISNFNICIKKTSDKYFFGTGMFSHMNYYDKYMRKLYPNGYIRVNYTDACSMFIRIFSEFGIIGLVIFAVGLIYIVIKAIVKKDILALFLCITFITQSMRLGEYNWIFNCMCFVLLLEYLPIKKYLLIDWNTKVNFNIRKEKKEKLLVFTGAFLPHNETITQISYKTLCNLDYDIDVVTFRSESDKSFEKYIKYDQKFKKFNIHYVDYDWKLLNINSHNFNVLKLNKILNSYVSLGMSLAKKNDYKAIFSFSMPNYTHYAAYKVNKRYKIKWFASFSDPICDNLYIEQLKKEKFKTKVLYFLLKVFHYNKIYQDLPLKNAYKLIFISDALKNHMVGNNDEYLKKSIIYPITYIKNWHNYKELKCLKKVKKEKKCQKVSFAHFGNIYGLRKIDKFIEAVELLISENPDLINKIEFHQYGEVDKKQIKNFNKKTKDVLIIHNRVDYKKCIDIMRQTDILLIFDTIVEDGINQPFLPSKIIDYLLTNKPIFAVTTFNSPLYSIIGDKHVCSKYDVNSIKICLEKLIKCHEPVKNNIKKFDNDIVSYDVFKNELKMIDNKE